MAHILEERYVYSEKAILVCDNLNTHTKGAFYEAFELERAHQLVRRIEFAILQNTVVGSTLPRMNSAP